MSTNEYKLSIIINTDGMNPGKAAAIVADAVLDVQDKQMFDTKFENWYNNSRNVAILQQPTERDVINTIFTALEYGLTVTPVVETLMCGGISSGTRLVAIAIGPEKSSILNKVTGNLKSL